MATVMVAPCSAHGEKRLVFCARLYFDRLWSGTYELGFATAANRSRFLHLLIIGPHRSTTYVDAAYSYRPSSVVCRSVGLSR